MSKFVDVEVIRHPVGADGTMRGRFTFNVAIDPAGADIPVTDLGRQFQDAMMAAFYNEAERLRGEVGKLRVAFGTSRDDGMPLPPIEQGANSIRIKVGDETVQITGRQPIQVDIVELEIAQSRQRQGMGGR